MYRILINAPDESYYANHMFDDSDSAEKYISLLSGFSDDYSYEVVFEPVANAA